jgi:hypothetical protein
MRISRQTLGAALALVLCAVALVPATGAAGPAPTPDATAAVRVPAAAYATVQRAGISPVRAIDYGAFVWMEVLPDDVSRLRAAGVPHHVVADAFVLNLGEARFDPLRDPVRYPAGWGPVPDAGLGLHLVQFAGPVRDEWLGGLEIVQYVHPFTYIVWSEADVLAQRAQVAEVRWTGPFAPAYRVLPRWRDLPDAPVLVDVLVYRGAGEAATLGALETLGGDRHRYSRLNDTFGVASYTLAGTAFRAAARIPGVYSIQPEPTDGGLRGEMSNQVNVNNLNASGYAVTGYPAWLASVGLSGAGVRIANVDGGVQDDHPDLASRLVLCTGQTCGGTAISGHGTHTAGIMAADGSSGAVDPYGFLRGLGMAPGANLVEQVYSPWFTYPGGMLHLMSDSFHSGAALSGNSWGPSGSPLGYDNDTMQVDIGVRDASDVLPGNQAFSYVLSIMNGNGGTSSQGTPDEAKNIFTIGSTKMQYSSGAQYLEIDDLSGNSAHGPALDGRKIPHMVAPGCYVDSTYSSSSYITACGTSMASPHVSGAVALFFEYYRQVTGSDPSPALVKAAFLPVAHDLAGHHDADGGVLGHPFDSKQGWGRMDAGAVLDPQMPVRYMDQDFLFDQTGEMWVEQGLAPADPTRPVRLMLVWTDAPGHGLGGSTPAWNNDLDLIVWAGPDHYLGNDFGPDGWSQPASVQSQPDEKNNTEGVFLPVGTAGPLRIEVLAANINSDGVPGSGDSTDQDFALVCYNCTQAGDFTLAVTPDDLALCAPGAVTSTVHVGEIPPFTQSVTLTLAGPPGGLVGSFSPVAVTPPGSALLTVTAGAAATGTHTLVVSGTAAGGPVHTATLSLHVSSGPPAVPVPTLPADGAAGVSPLAVTLGWLPAAGANRYDLRVAADPTLASPVAQAEGVVGMTYTLTTPLDARACYFWQVRGASACGAGDWSAPSRFGTASPGAEPLLTGVEPARGRPGEVVSVTIHGGHLAPELVALVGDVPLLSVTYVDSQTVTALVPATLSTGTYDLTVYNPDCQGATLPDAYTAAVTLRVYLPLVGR